jgi:hypothetical protein
MRVLGCLAVSVLLAGCVTEKTVDEMSYSEKVAMAQGVIQSCVDQGVAKDSPEMEACYNAETTREVARREKAADDREMLGLAVSESMRNYGDTMSRSSTYRRPTQCSSYQMGSTVNTTCY